ncbi:nucleotide exchange factor GrpE [Pseudidiomarina tainanensis]|jgi:molecular chaperone GrpE|uniref:Protein GrpE n=2 Tax=Pseudidiomarina TaxID=2800384 RepID=A0A1I6GMA1_9GAMM|nr:MULTISPECIES: nucleotide exchange factor GrpE [Pseudidiomarina]RZQ56447.1 nucleotide exchange factor GrpE [Pseudidiomarina tainanensis]SFR43279.1 molecular chaperone GrpE [Pseudidiomarina maritima]
MTKNDSTKATQAEEQQGAEAQAEQVVQDEQVESQATENESGDENQQRIEALELALSQAEQRADDANDRAVRAVAEMENVRRRSAQDVEKAHKFALEKFAGEILDTVDNLERAMDIAKQADDINQSFFEGIELTHKNLLSTLNKFGVEAVGAVGDAFNPELHQAMAMQPSEEHENNTVLAVMQKGYTLSGRLLRPAMVMVVKNS